jgi:hypothetical protein
MALDTALLRNIYGYAWDVRTISGHFRRIARKLGITDNVQFPGTDNFRMELVRRTASASRSVFGIDNLAADAKQSEPQFSDYFPPKKWIPRFSCSRRNWPKVKLDHSGQDHPVLGWKKVRFPSAELQKANVVPPEATNAHIAHMRKSSDPGRVDRRPFTGARYRSPCCKHLRLPRGDEWDRQHRSTKSRFLSRKRRVFFPSGRIRQRFRDGGRAACAA